MMLISGGCHRDAVSAFQEPHAVQENSVQAQRALLEMWMVYDIEI